MTGIHYEELNRMVDEISLLNNNGLESSCGKLIFIFYLAPRRWHGSVFSIAEVCDKSYLDFASLRPSTIFTSPRPYSIRFYLTPGIYYVYLALCHLLFLPHPGPLLKRRGKKSVVFLIQIEGGFRIILPHPGPLLLDFDLPRASLIQFYLTLTIYYFYLTPALS